MCRHVAYLGPSVTLDELLRTPAHALVEQAWAPNDMRGGGTINADGFGVGWFPAGSAEPARYRSASPMWTDESFADLARHVSATGVLAAVRSATAGMPVTNTACAPFTDGHWLFSHNGVVDGWPDTLAPIASALDTTDLMTLDAATDSGVLWAVLRQRLTAGGEPAAVVRELAEQVLRVAPESRLNLLLTDGSVLIGTTWTHALSMRRNEAAVLLASEPFGPGVWEQIPNAHLVVADTDDVHMSPLRT